ncbi:uncharacterized protein V1510DRAFT_423367 [Dipodascopsis tothii]|uniref:uncharacterized protein n=1 Tax=Dipodascopsis tothii TaxID=44089 RepID=UPI0034CFE082
MFGADKPAGAIDVLLTRSFQPGGWLYTSTAFVSVVLLVVLLAPLLLNTAPSDPPAPGPQISRLPAPPAHPVCPCSAPLCALCLACAPPCCLPLSSSSSSSVRALSMPGSPLDNDYFIGQLSAVTFTSSVDTVVRLCKACFGPFFDVPHSFRYRRLAAHEGPFPDCVVFELRRHSSRSRYPAILVVCRPFAYDTQTGWDEAISGPFLHHVRASSPRLFGAVVIGHQIRFYRVDNTLPALFNCTPINTGYINLRTVNGRIEATKMLLEIRYNVSSWVRRGEYRLSAGTAGRSH